MDQQRTAYSKPNPTPTQPNDAANQQGKKEVQISQSTKEKAEAAREFIEKRYSKLKQEKEEKEILLKKMENMNLNPKEVQDLKRKIQDEENLRLRNKRKKMSAKDFEPIAIIGRGAFGEVRLCRSKETREVVAMKKMNKSEMEKKNQIAHILAERNILASAQNPWIVELKYSFQDDRYLYLVMEYLAGGDLMTLLMKKDILTENEAKFYMAEAILAVESVHKLNYIHRDLKPDNILLDSKGHLKLSDFGLCKHTDIKPRFEFKKTDDNTPPPGGFDSSNLTKKPQAKRSRKKVFTIVGTPDYIAPEVFGQRGYTETVDWWSLGAILFEMLVGYPPFFSDDSSVTCQKIIHWKKYFTIPPEANLSPAAADLLRRLICDANERLGVNGVEEIKFHPFFAGVDWKNIRKSQAPNIPELKSETDTSNFDPFEEEEPWYIEDTTKARKTRKNANFIGYTFKRDFENQRPLLATALETLEAHKNSQLRQKTQQAQRVATEGPQIVDNKNYMNTNPVYTEPSEKSTISNKSGILNNAPGNYYSVQPRNQIPVGNLQLQNQSHTNQYTSDLYYSNTSYNKSPKAVITSTKQTFPRMMPDTREKVESKPKPTPQVKPGTAGSNTRYNAPSSLNKVAGGGMFKNHKNY